MSASVLVGNAMLTALYVKEFYRICEFRLPRRASKG